MGKDWFNIRIKTEPSRMEQVKSTIEGFPKEVMQKYYFQTLQSISASAADIMRHYIKSDPGLATEASKNRTPPGGRNKTGKMWESVKWKLVESQKGTYYKFEIGWLDGTPGYAIFQEHGTRTGVKAMNSIDYTMNFTRTELKLLETNPGGYKIKSASKPGD